MALFEREVVFCVEVVDAMLTPSISRLRGPA